MELQLQQMVEGKRTMTSLTAMCIPLGNGCSGYDTTEFRFIMRPFITSPTCLFSIFCTQNGEGLEVKSKTLKRLTRLMSTSY